MEKLTKKMQVQRAMHSFKLVKKLSMDMFFRIFAINREQ